MKTIFEIAKAELLNLFYSPVAWTVILFYFIVCGFNFTDPMVNYFGFQKVSLDLDPNWKGFDGRGLTKELTGRVLGNMVHYLYLFIPLLTMGVINREVNTGTIKLLYSSPIRIRDIVFGKYLGLLSLVIILTLIISIFLVSASLIIKNPEIYLHIAALLGVLFVANAYISIGLFISCITNYQIVAGVLTFVAFFVLNSVSGLWQQYDFFRDLTYFLSISGRASYFLSGLISTRDIFYFILVTILFLGFALIKLRSTQESRPWTVSFTRYASLFIVILLLGYISARPGQVAYWDLSRGKLNTIHPNTQTVIKELDGSPITVTLYTNLLGINAREGLPQNRNFYLWQVWEMYRRFYPDIKFKYVYYYDIVDGDSALYKTHPKKNIHQIAEKIAKEYGIRKSIFMKPDEVRKLVNLGEESRSLVMQLEYKGKKTWLRTYLDGTVWPNQSNVAGALRRLSRDSVPKILFTTNHYERDPYKYGGRNYGGHITNTGARSSLVNLGVDADTISLLSSEIPPATPALVVADPRSEMNQMEQDKIKAYLQKGGNAIILAEVKKQQMLNPIINNVGVNADNGTIVNPNNHEMPQILNAELTPAGAYLADEPSLHFYQIKPIAPIKIKIDGGANITYKETDGFKIEPIIEFKGNSKTWIENGILVVDSAAPEFSVQEGDIKYDKYVLGVKLTRNISSKEQRILITGDADLMSIERNMNLGNTFYSWILYNEYPVYANYVGPIDLLFTANAGTIKTLKITYSYIIPVILLMLAVILLIRRKRK